MPSGSLVQIDSTNSTTLVTYVIQATGVTNKVAVIAAGSSLDYGTGYMLAAIGPQPMCSVNLDALASAGDTFEAQASLSAHVNPASTSPVGRVKKQMTAAGLAACTLNGS